MNLRLIVLILLSSGLLVACNDEGKEKKSPVAEIKPAAEIKTVERNIDPVQYTRGARLYQLNCAKCHGKNAEGTPSWRMTENDGMYPPPPLNGTGHTWHLS